jgi:hypothetical protein
MTICLQVNAGTGALEVMPTQPADFSTCSMVLQSGSDVGVSPFAVSAADGTAISAAIIAVWLVGWGFRALILTLKEGNENV